jgi:hypothetical protein
MAQHGSACYCAPLVGAASLCAAWLLWRSEPVPLPPLDERAVDASTSLEPLRRSISCPLDNLAPLRLRWLPSSARASTDGAGVTPFVLLHELHVGEHWLVAMLRAAGVSVAVPQEKSVRAAARRWGTLAPVNGTMAEPPSAVGLALSPQALRILNHGIGAPASVRGARPVRLVMLSRRNRLKHAVSSHARQRGVGAGAFTVPIKALTTELEAGKRSFAVLDCTARELVARLSATAAQPRKAADGTAAHPPMLTPLSAGLDASSAPLLEVFYEDLLYDTAATMAKLLRHLGVSRKPSIDVMHRNGSITRNGSMAARSTGGAPSKLGGSAPVSLPMPAKRSPNSLCVRLSNWVPVCTAMQGTIWAADLTRDAADGATGSSTSSSSSSRSTTTTTVAVAGAAATARTDTCTCVAGSAGLVLGGAHHKTGTVLLERLLSMYASHSRVPYHKPTWERCPYMARREAGVCMDDHLSLARLRRFWMPPTAPPTTLLAPLVHVVREPLEACVSAYQAS